MSKQEKHLDKSDRDRHEKNLKKAIEMVLKIKKSIDNEDSSNSNFVLLLCAIEDLREAYNESC